ncbi:hypothetical protein EV175_005920, partial [Coemansia sp. RSA 1933]
MFRSHQSKSKSSNSGSNNWVLSPDHPTLSIDDTLPLTADLGDLTSLPSSYQVPVSNVFIQTLCDAAHYQNQSNLDWFNTKKKPIYRVSKFIDFVT